MVGHHDTGGTGFQRLQCALDGHNTLDDKGHAGIVDDLLQFLHRLGAGRGIQSLQEGQACGVNIHGKSLCARGFGGVQLGKDRFFVPGLNGGDALALVLTDGLGGGGKNGGVGLSA